jgi:L-ascorbate metabolism protein UlaG (beta-lactamase superfamily)
MKLQYFGHSMWKIGTEEFSVVIGPFDDIVYPMPVDLTADVVVISHEHHDHNNDRLVQGNPMIIRKAGLHQIGNLRIELIPSFHDEQGGSRRGLNHLILLEADGLKLLHCGDLGHLPEEKILSHIGRPDLLLIPVGEVYTLPLQSVLAVVKALKPTLVFPMHYKTLAIGFKLGEPDAFLKHTPGYTEHQESRIEIDSALLSCQRTIVMKPPV